MTTPPDTARDSQRAAAASHSSAARLALYAFRQTAHAAVAAHASKPALSIEQAWAVAARPRA